MTAIQRATLALASSMPATLDAARNTQLARVAAWNRRRLELHLDGEPMASAETQAEIEVFGRVTGRS